MALKTESKRKGVVLILVAIAGAVFIGLVGLAIDTAYVLYVAHQLQTGADAAALAGALQVGTDQQEAQTLARDIAYANYAGDARVHLALNPENDPNGDIVVGLYEPSGSPGERGVFTPTLESPNAVRVAARRVVGAEPGPVSLFFGRLFGIESVDITRSAVAVQDFRGGDGLVVLHAVDPCSMDMDSNARIVVHKGGIQINSVSTQALCMDSNAAMRANPVGVSGKARLRANVTITGALYEGASPLDDPLRDLAAPVPGPDQGAVRLNSQQRRTIEPGYYSGGISLKSNSELTLNPGVYILDGAGLQMSSNTSLIGEGVSIYVKNDVNPAASVLISNNTSLHLSPPVSGIYKDVTLWQSRDNANDLVLESNGAIDVEGAIYLPNESATLHIDSNGQILGNLILAYRVHMDSNAVVEIEETGLFAVPRQSSYLVR